MRQKLIALVSSGRRGYAQTHQRVGKGAKNLGLQKFLCKVLWNSRVLRNSWYVHICMRFQNVQRKGYRKKCKEPNKSISHISNNNCEFRFCLMNSGTQFIGSQQCPKTEWVFFFFWRGVRLLENIVWKHQKHETVLELRLSVSYSLVERNSTVLRGKSWKPKIPQCSMHLYARHWAWG